MAEQTGISWADATFNPWVGCEKVSPGCAHCYAETMVTGRMGRSGTWGADGVRERTSASLWKKPLRWAKLAREGKLPDGTDSPDGHRPRIFCASLADVFEPRPELEPWRGELFDLIERTPELDWMLLTKRPEEARGWLNDFYFSSDNYFRGVPIPLPNVWVGASVENARHTWRADALREVPAAVRFLSCEPLLGSLYDAGRAGDRHVDDEPVGHRDESLAEGKATYPARRAPLDLTEIDWVIVGGESGGRNARPMHPDWAREIRDAVLAVSACKTCDGRGWDVEVREQRDWQGEPLGPEQVQVECRDCYRGEYVRSYDGRPIRPALHFKQWGSWAPRGFVSLLEDIDDRPKMIVAGDRSSAREGGRVDWDVFYYGAAPKSGGKLLDGVEWCEFPASAASPVAA